MKALADIPLDTIGPGMPVINHNKLRGKVVKIHPKDREDYSIEIEWENGNTSLAWHFWLKTVFYDG